MAINQEYINETIVHIASVEAKAVVQAILVEGEDGDEPMRYRGKEADMRPKLAGPSPSYTFTNEVKSINHTCDVAKRRKHSCC